jgi:hypothetical protein
MKSTYVWWEDRPTQCCGRKLWLANLQREKPRIAGLSHRSDEIRLLDRRPRGHLFKLSGQCWTVSQ